MAEKKSPLDFTELFKAYDPANLSQLFSPEVFKSWFGAQQIKGFDPMKLLADHHDRVDALIQANEDAGNASRRLAESQAQIFTQIMEAAQKSLKNLDMTTSPNAAQRNMKTYSEALERPPP